MTLIRTHKDLLEFLWWKTPNEENSEAARGNKMLQYLEAFGLTLATYFPRALEIGTGPKLGMLSIINADMKVGVDPLYDAYLADGLMVRDHGMALFSEPFEDWGTAEKFEAIFCIDALDHGDLGFQYIPRMVHYLTPGGRLYLHAHLRPIDLLNLIHDHQLHEEDLNTELALTALKEIKRVVYENDIDGKFCKTIVGVWEKPSDSN